MQDTLGLDDADDRDDLQTALETSFGIQFSEAEAIGCRTVGDIFQVVLSRFPSPGEDAERCVTAMAFYRLRTAVAGLGVETRLTPDTCLLIITGLPARKLFRELGRRSGLYLPTCQAAPLGWIGGWTALGGLMGLLPTIAFAPQLWFACAATSLLGFLLICLDPGRVPPDCQTLGSLARKVAGLNFGTLHALGAKPSGQALWNGLVEVLSEHTLLPKTIIHTGTAISGTQRRIERTH